MKKIATLTACALLLGSCTQADLDKIQKMGESKVSTITNT